MDNNMWREDQEAFLEKLMSTQAVFDDIMNKDPNGMVIAYGEEREKFDQMREHNKRTLDKLRNKEFTVAIVGLEKAGKSTLGNAILERDILPADSQRCTYTTTKICAGSEDKGQIFFYSKEEFDRDFAEMLKQMKYEGMVTFDTLNLSSFESWWQTMEEKDNATYNQHNGTTFEDIKAMVAGRDVLRGLLGKSPQTFTGEALGGVEFQKFITGIVGKNPDGDVQRVPHPYAVKSVIIESNQLGKMQHIVLYDVPGFDSPTALHTKLTLEMLEKADAIILVTNVGTNPNLTSPQLGMLRRGQDADNVPLKDKVFVFGNKLDLARNIEDARGNMAALKKDATQKHNIALENRVICGSVMAYKESQGLVTGSNESSNTLDGWQITPKGYGFGELLDKLQDYYDNDRFIVLKRRAENTIREARKYLEGILEKYSAGSWQPIETGGEYYLEAARKLRQFREAAYVMGEECRNEILESKVFSNLIRENIDDIFPEQEIDPNELLTQVKRSGNINVNGQLAITRLNTLFREELSRQFLEKIVSVTMDESKKREDGFYGKLIDKFLEIMGMPPNSPNAETLRKSVDKLFHDLWIKDADRVHFNSLVERFISGLLEAMISRPFASYERYEAIAGAETFPEFLSLAIYYDNSPDFDEPGGEDRQMDFFAKIILHEKGLEDDGNKNALSKFFNENKDTLREGASLALDFLPMSKWGKMLLKAGIKMQDMNPALKKKLQDVIYKGNWGNLTKQEKTKRLEEALSSYIKENPVSPIIGGTSGRITLSDNPMAKRLLTLHQMSKLEDIKTEEEMLDILNEDIRNLKDFTLKAVIYAVGLERAFISVITKNTNRIRKDEETERGGKIFDKWIQDNIRLVKTAEFADLDRRNMDNQTKKHIVEQVSEVVEKLEVR